MYAKLGTMQMNDYQVFEMRFIGSSVIKTLVWHGDSLEKLAQDHPRDDPREDAALTPRKIEGGNLKYRFEHLVNGAHQEILDPRAIFFPTLTVNPFSLGNLADYRPGSSEGDKLLEILQLNNKPNDRSFILHRPDRDSKWMRGD